MLLNFAPSSGNSSLSPNVPIKLSPKALRENEKAVKEPDQGLVEVQPQLRKIVPSDMKFLLMEGRRLPPPGVSPRQNYVYPGEGLSLHASVPPSRSQEDRPPWTRRRLITTRYVQRTTVYASRKRIADADEVPSGSRGTAVREGATNTRIGATVAVE